MKLVDVYCPRCWGFRTELTTSFDLGGWYWDCSRCGSFRHPSNSDAVGNFEWTWSDEYPAPNPGCPWCGTRHIQWLDGTAWGCLRSTCDRMWHAHWTRKHGQDRWLIKFPVSEMPWTAYTKYGTFTGKGRRYPVADYWKYGPGSEVDDDDCGNGCEYICYH